MFTSSGCLDMIFGNVPNLSRWHCTSRNTDATVFPTVQYCLLQPGLNRTKFSQLLRQLGLKTKWRANVLLYPWYYSLYSLPNNALEQTNSVENTTPLEDSGLRGQNAELGWNFPISWSFCRCSRGLLGLSTTKDVDSSISNLSVLCSLSAANGARNLLLHNPLFGKTLKPVVTWWTSFIFF